MTPTTWKGLKLLTRQDTKVDFGAVAMADASPLREYLTELQRAARRD